MDTNPPSLESKPPYQFWAFISYSRKDEQQAKRLHEFIETFGVPVELVKHHTTPLGEAAPSRLRPCFRDKDDLPSDSSVSKALREKLAASRFLVVVCSPNSAASVWVDKEIEEFRILHGETAESRIHALIIAGDPNPGATDCCFPPSLRGQDPCALNATALGEGDRVAKLKLIAAMLGVPPDAIIQRDQERRMRRMKLTVSATLVFTSVLGWFWWQASVSKDAEEVAKNRAQAALIAANKAREAEKVAKERAIQAEAKTAAELKETTIQKQRAVAAELRTAEQLTETQRQLERSWLEEGRSWLERAKAALNKGDQLSALMFAGRAVGYQGYGRLPKESAEFTKAFPLLLAKPMTDATAEQERQTELKGLTQFIASTRPTLPLWRTAMSRPVDCVAFSPDGRLLASGSQDNTIKLWDAASGKEIATLAGHTHVVSSVAFSPDGKRLASGSWDHTIKLWEVVSGNELATLAGHTDSVYSVAFSPDGKRLASGSLDRTIKLWDVASGKELAALAGHTLAVNSVAFNPDGRGLASASDDHTIKVWDWARGKDVATLDGRTNSVISVAFSPDGRYLAAGSGDKTIKFWDLASGEELTSLAGHKSSVTSVAFSPDGTRLASGASDQSSDNFEIKIWNVPSGGELASLAGHTNSVTSVAFSPDGSRLASGSSDTTIKLWDVTSGKNLASLAAQREPEPVTSMAFSPDGSLLAGGSWDHTIKVWEVTTGKELASLAGHEEHVTSVAFSPDGRRIVSGSGDKKIKLWDVARGNEVTMLAGHKDTVTSVAFSPDGRRLASGSEDQTVKLWDVATGKELASLAGHEEHVTSVAFSPDGRLLASGSKDQTVKLWDVASGKELASLAGHFLLVSDVVFSPDGGRLASRSWDKTIKLWDIASGKELAMDAAGIATAIQWLVAKEQKLSPDIQTMVAPDGETVYIVTTHSAPPDLAIRLREDLLALPGRALEFPEITGPTKMLPVRSDAYTQLANPDLIPAKRAELQMLVCTKSSQFRAASAQWQRLLQGEWPGFEGATVPKDQVPATISADSPIRRLYLLALIDATKHPQIHGHPTICQTASQIAPVLTKEMMAMPTISLAMMSLMQTLAKDDSPDMSAPRAALLERLDEVATKEWLAVRREGATK